MIILTYEFQVYANLTTYCYWFFLTEKRGCFKPLTPFLYHIFNSYYIFVQYIHGEVIVWVFLAYYKHNLFSSSKDYTNSWKTFLPRILAAWRSCMKVKILCLQVKDLPCLPTMSDSYHDGFLSYFSILYFLSSYPVLCEPSLRN